MDANANGREDKPLSLKEIREQKRLIRAKLELHQLKNAERVLEASANWDYWLSSYVDLLDRYRDGGRLAYPISQPTDRRYGQNWPFWNTETQLSLLRAQARLLCTMNGYAIGLLSGLQAYVIGDGFQYRAVDRKSQGDSKKSAKPSSFALKVQEIIDEFCDVNDWSEWERELFWRSREDGEFFLRFYPDNDNRCMTVRCVEPEQVSMTGVPEATQEHWSFGIHTDPEDVQTVYGYNVLYMADPSNHANQIREEVPIEEILHFKINVKRTVKRGLSDFAFSTHDAFTVAEKLRNNMAEGAAVQSALAYIRQHESATQAQIQNFLNTQQIDFTRANPLTGQQINYKQFEPGTIADIPRGMQYVQPPGAGNASGFIDILHATLRGAGCRWNAPEWLATGSGADMASYTASLTAHAPFVRSATQKQNAYKKAFTQVLWEAIEYAIDYGRLPLDTPHLIDIQCEAPSILARDERDEAQANQIRVTDGWKSRQTVQQEEGLDPEQEMQNIEAYNERFGQGRQVGGSGRSGPVPVQEHNFNPSQLRDRFGKWTKASDEDDVGAGHKDENPTGSIEFLPAGMELVVNATADEHDTKTQYRQASKSSIQPTIPTDGRLLPGRTIDKMVERGQAKRLSPDNYVYVVQDAPGGGFQLILLKSWITHRKEITLTDETVHKIILYQVVDIQTVPFPGGDREAVKERFQRQRLGQLHLDVYRSGVNIVEAVAKLADELITTPAPLNEQNGPEAYRQGLCVGLYEFGKESLGGLAQLPEMFAHPQEVIDNFKKLGSVLLNGLKDLDPEALRAIDKDLYRLVTADEAHPLTEWERARLTVRVTLRYALLIEGGVNAAKMVGQLGKKAIGKAEALAQKIVQQVKKGEFPRNARAPLEPPKAPKVGGISGDQDPIPKNGAPKDLPQYKPPGKRRSLWDIKSIKGRGLEAEERLGGRTGLHEDFPVIDRFENGTATSVRTMNLRDSSYQKPSRITSRGEKCIDEVSAFATRENVTYAKRTIFRTDVKQRALDLVVPQNATPAQRQALQGLIEYGQRLKPPVSVRIVEME